MSLSTPPHARRERDLLHAGGRRGTWGSLGCWRADTPDYASACEALAQRVAEAAALGPGSQVLCLACGAGDELLWLTHVLRADNTTGEVAGEMTGEVIGVEIDAALVQASRALTTAAGIPVQVLLGDGCALDRLGLPPASFDQVLCIDAAYHLRPREDFLRQAFALLRPGGRLAYTDLCLEPVASVWRSALLRGAARLCGLARRDLLPAAAQVVRLESLGFTGVQQQRLDDEVLGGFVRFMQRQAVRVDTRAWARGARRAIRTARLIGPCRAAGLGYVLLAGSKPSSDAAAA